VHPGRRLALFVVVSAAICTTVLLAAFSSTDTASFQTTPPAQASRLLPSGPPSSQVVALGGQLRIQLPIAQNRVTAIGFHGGTDGALALDPVGTQANQGVFQRVWHALVGDSASNLRWYQLSGGAGAPTSAVDIGAAAGTDVYAPLDGTLVGLAPFVLDGKPRGYRLEIQPSSAPSTVLVLTRLKADPALTVGAAIVAGSTKIGTVLDLSRIERQALARYTNDAGNHVTLEQHPAATFAVP
jgi:hypothetical protein